MKKRKLYRYYVTVDTPGHLDAYFVEAHNAEEAKQKAKDKFASERWKRSLLKASIEFREEVKQIM